MSEIIIDELVEKLIRAGMDFPAVMENYRSSDMPASSNSLRLCNVVRKLITKGNSRIAFELARSETVIQKSFKTEDDFELEYLSALALSRGGNIFGAESIVSKLLLESGLSGAIKSDVLSLKARLLKDQVRLKSCTRRNALANESATAYEQAYEITPSDLYPAINAATMWKIAGSQEKSRVLAQTVCEQILATNIGKLPDNYWDVATLGESLLLLGKIEDASQVYQHAVKLAGTRYGDIASMASQLRLLENDIPEVTSILTAFDVGRVVVFSGSMMRTSIKESLLISSQSACQLPADNTIRKHIRSKLSELKCRIAYSSVACGCDIIFCEVALELGIELRIVLPFHLDDFYRTSVDFGLPEYACWKTRCDVIINSDVHVYYSTRDPFLNDNLLFEFANDVMQGLAITEAAEFGSNAISLIITDRSLIGRRGGANQFLEKWTAQGREAVVVDLAEICLIQTEASVVTESVSGVREIKSMLFADVKGFSRLQEEQNLTFFLHFLKEVAEILKQAKVPPIFKNTWGDGLFLVFENASDCADLALQLCERISNLDFKSLGLPGDLMVRVGIHAGPVFRWADPIMQKESFFGSHVNRAARIEPVTMPGCVYASEQMAALLAITENSPFRCEYVGKMDLAKGFDTCSLFHVLRA